MGRKSVRGDKKLCTGPLHRDGVWLPVWDFATSGNGKYLSQCRRCRATYQQRDPDNVLVPIEEARPIFEELARVLGGKLKACAALGVGPPFYSSLRKIKGVRGLKVKKAKKLLAESRKLHDQPIEDWWIEYGTGYELPRFGAEVLGDDF